MVMGVYIICCKNANCCRIYVNKIINELESMNNKIKINNTSDLFNSLKMNYSVINNDQLNSLNEKGYVIFPPIKL